MRYSVKDLQAMADHIKSVGSEDDVDPKVADKLDSMSFGDTYLLRKMVGNENKTAQNIVAPYDHQAYVREAVAAEPGLGTVQQSILIPGYTATKALGMQQSRSDPSLTEMYRGYKGIYQGLLESIGK
jgi:hypothetical protein